MMQEKGENKMPKGKGTYGKQVGRPSEDASRRSVKTYAGGGLTGYDVPQPTWDQGSVARQFRMEEGGKVKSVSEKNKEKREAIKKANKDMASKGKSRREARRAKRAAKKSVKVVKTKGGDYPVYKKESKKAESFRGKFSKARKAGKSTFKWKGRSYTTQTKADAAKAKPKAKAIAKPKPKTFKGETAKEKARLDKEYAKGAVSTPKPKYKIIGIAKSKSKSKPKKRNIIGPIVANISKRKKK